MRIWLIGAGTKGTEALRQLQKNADIEVIVSDPTPRPKAVEEGVIGQVDHVEVVTQANINTLARRIRPDLILIDTSQENRHLGRVSGGQALSEALFYEIAATSDYPCLLI
ncbi:hypothetical protein FKZ61_012660 [Litorilinea aerophila]|uniref:RCK N-terminal domain-containing protein n=1 Tax=Litorilinea aerophila TaxID=1204385 RepID=A0A540VF94_9CHLR|nr:hypothetical protein [Litorilinea aerophila]MCC9076957.1 hypothetical protein [Litorilinea aerophila]OUC07140.1 hypothetical protein RY27_16690 [Litorilinea aerophila]GIV78533.1 MAG: hypothetical protein KatS3mg050_2927 [Litorilinea sp.]